jgi:hypothetical protein
VAPDKTFTVRGMYIFFGVRMAVVSAMVSCPPKRASLSRTTGDKGTNKLDEPRGFERTVGKIAVIKRGDRKHSNTVRN